MKRQLKNLLTGIQPVSSQGNVDVSVNEIVFDSRQAKAGSLFVAIQGFAVDGHDFIQNVIENGCEIIVAQHAASVPEHVTLILVPDSAEALGIIASNYYDNPSQQLELVGITGTNGKTTTVTLLHNLFTQLGHKTGLISTVVNKVGKTDIPSTHTTPNPVELNKLLSQMVENQCEYCFMEVSSHAIVQKRIAGLKFAGGAFSNITHDHLDYHKTFKSYIDAKKAFFDHLDADAFALTNVDDKNGNVMMQNTKATKYSYALRTPADFKAKVIENLFSGLVLNLDGTELWSRLIGDFNAYNLLLAYSISQLLNQDKIEVLTVLSNLESVEGRFQYIRSDSGIIAIVDYAHTPDALENVLKTIANIRTKNETVFTITGCGGDRDKTKRPIMAKIACDLSDKVIITSDNPRTENPSTIIEEMMAGVEGQHFNKTLSIEDRAQAIKTACVMAIPGDIILIAGKGHEKYQDINGVKHDFDDLKTVTETFLKLKK